MAALLGAVGRGSRTVRARLRALAKTILAKAGLTKAVLAEVLLAGGLWRGAVATRAARPLTRLPCGLVRGSPELRSEVLLAEIAPRASVARLTEALLLSEIRLAMSRLALLAEALSTRLA